jgi:hypothetical protein
MSITTYPNGLQYDHLFCNRRQHVLDSGSAELETTAVHGTIWQTRQNTFGLDSHTPAGGGIGMLAIGTGGLDVAPAAAGERIMLKCPNYGY